MATSEDFVQKCLDEAGDEYVYGAENEPGIAAADTTEWDCSELVQVKLNELGIDAPDGSNNQLEWCRENGTLIPLEEGKSIRGSLLLRNGHVAVSLGNGQTIEAKGTQYGVGVFSAENRTFTHAATVPGLEYGAESTPKPKKRYADRRPKLQLGSRGGPVRFLQKRLAKLGYSKGMIDGEFGKSMKSAVSAFQGDNGLEKTGVVNRKTWRNLAPGRKSRKGLKKREGKAG